MNRLPFLAQRLFNRPLCILPGKAEVIMAALADRFGVTRFFHGVQPVALSPYDPEDEEAGYHDDPRPYGVIEGVGIIPIHGTLVAKLGTMRPYSGMTGYDGIRVVLQQALADDEVRAIVLDVDSPGGECAGMFDLADMIYAARGTKPIWSILNEEAYSAGYALASAADRVIVPRTGGTGSVGVIMLHSDLSQALSKEGITVTLIRFGAQKFEGNPYEPLSETALAGLQADANYFGELFVDLVARHRGLSAAAVRATQAACFTGPAGVAIGFADEVMAPDAAFAALLDTLS